MPSHRLDEDVCTDSHLIPRPEAWLGTGACAACAGSAALGVVWTGYAIRLLKQAHPRVDEHVALWDAEMTGEVEICLETV